MEEQMAKALKETASGNSAPLKEAIQQWTQWHLDNVEGPLLNKGLAVAKVLTEYHNLAEKVGK